MPTRRTHQKSRNGCETCKRRHVKCDECGPPCGQCKARSIDCVHQKSIRDSSAIVQNEESARTITTSQPTQAAEKPCRLLSDRFLELELMHQWTISTYKSMCGALEIAYPVWQQLVPREALKHEYLLWSMLAMSALEIAMSSEHRQTSNYLSTALEYQDLALNSFRTQITDVTESNSQAIFAFSVITMVLTMAIPQCDGSSLVEGMVFHYDHLRGVRSLVRSSVDSLRESPLLANLKAFEEGPSEKLESSVETAFERLNAVNDVRNDPARKESREAKLQVISHHAVCRKAIFHLEEFFARCVDPLKAGYSLGWLQLAGQEFVQAIKESDPVALLLLMYWGVLAERINDGIWWAKYAGKSLVEELSGAIDAGDDLELGAAISWAREQVGLETASQRTKSNGI